MTTSEIKRVLSGIGVNTSSDSTGYIQIPELKYINMMSDGNQVIDYYTDFLNFDFKNNILRIKEKDVTGISRYFNISGAIVNGNKITLDAEPYTHNKFSFRKYQKGDIIYYVNKETLQRDPSKDDIIVDVDGKTITLKNSIQSLSKYYICYASTDFSKAVLNPNDNRLALLYTDRGDTVADIYFGFRAIVGFSFVSGTTSFI